MDEVKFLPQQWDHPKTSLGHRPLIYCVCTLGVVKRGRYAEVLEAMVSFACSSSRDIIELLSQC